MSQKWQSLVLALVAFLLYANTISHDYVLDDAIITTKNTFVQEGISGIPAIFTHGFLYGFNEKNDQSYRPLVLANMALEVQIFGNNPTAHHFFNVFLYSLTAICLFWLMTLLFQNYHSWLPFLATLLFIVHPIHTEVVANIKSRDEILCLLFMIGSLLTLFKYLQNKKWIWLLLSLACYFDAILAKEIGLMLIVVIPVILWTVVQQDWKRVIQTSLPFIGVIVIYFGIRFMVMDSMTFDQQMGLINNALSGADSLAERWATAILILGKYLQKLLLPYPLSFDYSYNQIPLTHFTNPLVIISLLAYIGLIGLAIFSIWKRHLVAVGIVWFLAMILLVSNFLTLVGATMAERFLYSPSVGFSLLVAWGLFKVFQKTDPKFSLKQAQMPLLIGAVIAIICSAWSFNRNQDWKDSKSLFLAGVKTSPNSARAHNHLASVYRMEAEVTREPNKRNTLFAKAAKGYEKSLKIHPDYKEAAYNLGVCLLNLGNKNKAQKAFEKTIELVPNHEMALNNLGVIHYQKKELDQAEQYFKKVLLVNEQADKAYTNLGVIAYSRGDISRAIEYYQKSLKYNPNNRLANEHLARIRQEMGQ